MPDHPTSPSRFTSMMRALAADTRDAPNTIRQAEALKACIETLRSIGYADGCEVVVEMLGVAAPAGRVG